MPKQFFTESEEKNIISSIQEAEKNTSGEIRLHVDARCKKDALERAKELFSKLSMHKTELRNGVLVYISMEDHKLAVWGDEGIHSAAGQTFWDDEIASALDTLGRGDIIGGLTSLILDIGDKLKEQFPYQKDDKNELSDDISTGL